MQLICHRLQAVSCLHERVQRAEHLSLIVMQGNSKFRFYPEDAAHKRAHAGSLISPPSTRLDMSAGSEKRRQACSATGCSRIRFQRRQSPDGPGFTFEGAGTPTAAI